MRISNEFTVKFFRGLVCCMNEFEDDLNYWLTHNYDKQVIDIKLTSDKACIIAMVIYKDKIYD